MNTKRKRNCKNCCYIDENNECEQVKARKRFYFSEQMFSKVYEKKLKIPDFIINNAHCNWHQFKEK